MLLAVSSQVPWWLALPFAALLGLIATGPLFFKEFWHHYYKHIAVAIGSVVLLYYLFVLGDTSHPVHSSFEYFSFISLLAALFVVTGGIYVKIDVKPTVVNNIILLLFGAVISNFIGTTGASVLLIRPFLRINQQRYKPYLVVFFIFIVSNVGGSLTPIGDPPLFLGFLRGVPFGWTFQHLLPAWSFAIAALLAVFALFDYRNKSEHGLHRTYTGELKIEGGRNIGWLVLLIGTVFLDPAKISWLPSLGGHSFVREALQLGIAFAAFKTSDKEALYYNRFSFEPILEVAFLFFGIFLSMMPALQLLQEFVSTPGNIADLTPTMLYWGTGVCSSFLDNAPSYLTFLTAAMSFNGMLVSDPTQVYQFAFHPILSHDLVAISVAAVFFGAMTYIGNGPNFMVKSIVEEHHREMPSFAGYIFRYAVPILLPILILVWFLFIR